MLVNNMEVDYVREVNKFNEMLKEEIYVLKDNYNNLFIDNANRFATKICSYKFPSINDKGTIIDERDLAPYFIESLEVFDDDTIIDYYRKMLPKVRIFRDPELEKGAGSLNYSNKKKQLTSYLICLPKDDLSIIDQTTYAHEMGHIPEIYIKRLSYYEYSETLPMLMEFLTLLSKYQNFDTAFDNFILDRVKSEQKAAFTFKINYLFFKDKNDDTPKDYCRKRMIESYKYLSSLDFTIKLLYIMRENKDIIGREISQVIKGKSFMDVSYDLDINSDSAKLKALRKEVKRMQKK